MNERIKELEKQSLDYFWSLDDSVRTTDTFTANSEFTKKFAELIVRECAKVLTQHGTYFSGEGEPYHYAASLIEEHFGVEE